MSRLRALLRITGLHLVPLLARLASVVNRSLFARQFLVVRLALLTRLRTRRLWHLILLMSIRLFVLDHSARRPLATLRRPFSTIFEEFAPRAVQNLRIIAVKPNVIRILDALYADFPLRREIKHRLRISLLTINLSLTPITLDNAPPLLLIRNRRLPRLINILVRKLLQLRDKLPHEIALLVPLLRKRNRAVAPVELGVEGRAAQPLPIADIARGFVVNQPLLEHLRAALPIDVAPAAREETGNGVPAEVVDPAFVLELAHQRVDPGEACAAFAPALEVDFGLGVVD